MASGPPEHHVDRLGCRLADRSCNFVLAAEKRLALPIGRSHIFARGRPGDHAMKLSVAAASSIPLRDHSVTLLPRFSVIRRNPSHLISNTQSLSSKGSSTSVASISL